VQTERYVQLLQVCPFVACDFPEKCTFRRTSLNLLLYFEKNKYKSSLIEHLALCVYVCVTCVSPTPNKFCQLQPSWNLVCNSFHLSPDQWNIHKLLPSVIPVRSLWNCWDSWVPEPIVMPPETVPNACYINHSRQQYKHADCQIEEATIKMWLECLNLSSLNIICIPVLKLSSYFLFVSNTLIMVKEMQMISSSQTFSLVILQWLVCGYVMRSS
jgi:hypothetical protein